MLESSFFPRFPLLSQLAASEPAPLLVPRAQEQSWGELSGALARRGRAWRAGFLGLLASSPWEGAQLQDVGSGWWVGELSLPRPLAPEAALGQPFLGERGNGGLS